MAGWKRRTAPRCLQCGHTDDEHYSHCPQYMFSQPEVDATKAELPHLKKQVRYETCPFCEASFVLVDGKFPRHLDVFRKNTCTSVDKTLAEANATAN